MEDASMAIALPRPPTNELHFDERDWWDGRARVSWSDIDRCFPDDPSSALALLSWTRGVLSSQNLDPTSRSKRVYVIKSKESVGGGGHTIAHVADANEMELHKPSRETLTNIDDACLEQCRLGWSRLRLTAMSMMRDVPAPRVTDLIARLETAETCDVESIMEAMVSQSLD